MSSRLGKQVQHKTKQAEKLLQMLKQKREKKKMQEPTPADSQSGHKIVVHSELGVENKKNSSVSINDSFRTCTNADGHLAELYFKIFSEHMSDPSQAVVDLENCMQNMSKQVIKTAEQLTFNRQLLKTANEKIEKMGTETSMIVSKFTQEISDLQRNLQTEQQRNAELMEKKNEPSNTSAIMNASVVYDGYEEKIKQLSDKLEKKQIELRDAWDRNRDSQIQIFELQKKQKNIERQRQQQAKQRDILKQRIEKLTSEIQNRDSQKVELNIQALTLRQNEIAQLRQQHSHQMEQMNIKLNELRRNGEDQMVQLRLTIEECKKKQQRLNKEMEVAKRQQDNLIMQNKKTAVECKQLNQSLRIANQSIKSLSNQITGLRKQKQSAELQLKSKIEYYSCLNENTSDKISVLLSQKHECEQIVKETKAEYEEASRNFKFQIAQLDAKRKKEVEKLQKDLASCLAEISNLKQHNEHMKQEMNSKQVEVSQFINITEQLTQQLTNAKQELDEYENRINMMKEQNVELIQTRERQRNELAQLMSTIKKMQAQSKQNYTRLQQSVTFLKSKVEEQVVKNEKLSRQNQGLQEEMMAMKLKQKEQCQKMDQRHRIQKQEALRTLQDQIIVTQQKRKAAEARCQQLATKLEEQRRQSLQLLANVSPDTNQVIEEITSTLKNEIRQKKQSIERLNSQNTELKGKNSNLVLNYEQVVQQLDQCKTRIKSMGQQKNRDNAKHIKTIEQLTQQLNDAYKKVNEHTRISLEKDEKRRNDESRDKNNRAKSVNKLKSYFGFGNKTEQ